MPISLKSQVRSEEVKAIVPVQALRGVAAISVAICHFDQISLIIAGRGNDPIPFHALASGVDIFFVISGFVMLYSSSQLFAAKSAVAVFLIRRVARIVPLYWSATILTVLMPPRHVYWLDALRSAFFVPYFGPDGSSIEPLYGVGWTLNYEMFFYTLFALSLRWPQRIAVPALCAFLCGLVTLGYLAHPANAALQFWTDPIVLEFVYGIMIATLFQSKIVLPDTLRISMILGGILTIWLTEIHLNQEYRALHWGLPAAAIVAAAVLGPREEDKGTLAALAILLGEASYAIYLAHPLIGKAIILAWPRKLNAFPVAVVLATGMIAVVAISIVVHKVFERGATGAIRRLLERCLTMRLQPALNRAADSGHKPPVPSVP